MPAWSPCAWPPVFVNPERALAPSRCRCKLRDKSGPGATIKVGQAIDAIAATFPGEALGGRDATAHGTEHDTPAAQAGEEPARDRAGVGTESGDGGPSAGGAGRSTAATTTSSEADRS